MSTLSTKDIEQSIAELEHNWELSDNKLTVGFTATNYLQGLDLLVHAGKIAEDLQHHPDVSLKDYKQVTITTTTHDAGNTITDKDIELAAKIDSLLTIFTKIKE